MLARRVLTLALLWPVHDRTWHLPNLTSPSTV